MSGLFCLCIPGVYCSKRCVKAHLKHKIKTVFGTGSAQSFDWVFVLS